MKTITVKYIDTTKYKVKVHQELDNSDDPTSWGNFTIVQFKDDDWTTYEDPYSSDYFTESGKLTPGTLARLRAGTMFTMSYSRYASADGGHYRLDGAITGTIDDIDGFIIFDPGYIKGISYEERKRYAEQDLETYTQFAQGDVYWVEIETEDGRAVDSCGGLYGTEGIKAYIEEVIPGAEYEAIGVDDGYSTGSSTYEITL